jgi:hypothetical protein
VDGGSLKDLMLLLLTSIKFIAGYPIPEQLPTMHFVPHSILEEKACHKPCEILGWLSTDNEIYLDEKLDLKGSIQARSVLLHELVHYNQKLTGRFDNLTPCERWIKQEREAYTIQNHWLFEQGAPTLSLRLLNLETCVDEPKDTEKIVAVIDFKLDLERATTHEPGDELLAKKASDQLRVELSKTGQYTLINQDRVTQILQSGKYRELSCSDICALEIGKAVNANRVITGKIIKISSLIWQASARISDVKTGRILREETLELKGNFSDLIPDGMAALLRRIKD